ncbi:MAG: hypothetical protein DRP56_09565 [Planctomycetota bacterium]|nr:MAG: hypothetical protein DRP56_09565 [Planctomycetota bacterium]
MSNQKKSTDFTDFSKKEQTQGSREKQKTQIIRQIKNYSVAIKKRCIKNKEIQDCITNKRQKKRTTKYTKSTKKRKGGNRRFRRFSQIFKEKS